MRASGDGSNSMEVPSIPSKQSAGAKDRARAVPGHPPAEPPSRQPVTRSSAGTPENRGRSACGYSPGTGFHVGWSHPGGRRNPAPAGLASLSPPFLTSGKTHYETSDETPPYRCLPRCRLYVVVRIRGCHVCKQSEDGASAVRDSSSRALDRHAVQTPQVRRKHAARHAGRAPAASQEGRRADGPGSARQDSCCPAGDRSSVSARRSGGRAGPCADPFGSADAGAEASARPTGTAAGAAASRQGANGISGPAPAGGGRAPERRLLDTDRDRGHRSVRVRHDGLLHEPAAEL